MALPLTGPVFRFRLNFPVFCLIIVYFIYFCLIMETYVSEGHKISPFFV